MGCSRGLGVSSCGRCVGRIVLHRRFHPLSSLDHRASGVLVIAAPRRAIDMGVSRVPIEVTCRLGMRKLSGLTLAV